MTNKNKFKVYLCIAVVFFILSVIIFIIADGLRRWYSGAFFFILGSVTIVKAYYTFIVNKKNENTPNNKL